MGINDVLSSVKVCLVGLDALALSDEHVAEEHDDVERDSEISSDEVLVVEVAGRGVDEDVEVLGQADEDCEEQADDGTPVALRGDIGHGAVGDVLSAASTKEEEVGDKDGNPGQDTEDGDEVDKVAKDLIVMLARDRTFVRKGSAWGRTTVLAVEAFINAKQAIAAQRKSAG